MKLKTQVQVTENVDIDIDLPYYCAYSDNHFLKVLGKKTITVKTYDFSTEITVVNTDYVYNQIHRSKLVTEEEFLNALLKAQQVIRLALSQEVIEAKTEAA